MGVNGEIHGVTSDFRYQLKLAEPSTPNSPRNGIYNGYFWMKVVPPKRVNDNGIHITFTKDDEVYQVVGTGSNKLGPFELHGTYNPVTSTMVCDKIYVSPDTHEKKRPKPKPRQRTRSSTEHSYSQGSHSRLTPVAEVGKG